MRTIKFRGKSICEDTITTRDRKINKGDWVYGSLIVDNQPYIVGEIADVDREFIAPEFWIPVDEKTVGQFTRQYDRTKKEYVEIYENDIVKNTFNNQIYVVMWVNIYGYYALIPIDLYHREKDIIDYLIVVEPDIDNVHRFYNTLAVIGNIHEEVEE